MMRIFIQYFAITREKTGLTEQHLDVNEGATVGALWDKLVATHPSLAPLRRHVRVAVNMEYVKDEHVLQAQDEVALIPPVAGGVDMCTLTEAAIDPAMISARVARDEAGALAMFCGVVRNHAKGRAVDHLVYEIYQDMALAKLREVVSEVQSMYPACLVAVEHRYGRLDVGEMAVCIAVSSPHRAEAFAACQMTIDRIKEVVPIWKKEFGPDGSSWVGMGS